MCNMADSFAFDDQQRGPTLRTLTSLEAAWRWCSLYGWINEFIYESLRHIASLCDCLRLLLSSIDYSRGVRHPCHSSWHFCGVWPWFHARMWRTRWSQWCSMAFMPGILVDHGNVRFRWHWSTYVNDRLGDGKLNVARRWNPVLSIDYPS